MATPYYLLLPLMAAIVYAASGLFYKRAFHEGVGLARSFFISNVGVGLAFLPLLLLEERPIPWRDLLYPVATGVVFFLGNVLNFMAIRAGDVSLVTPLMGAKVIFVAMISALLFGFKLQPGHWWAAALTTTGVFMLGATDFARGRGLGKATICALSGSFLFALSDTMLQRWGGPFGVFNFVPLLFGTVALLAFTLIPAFRAPLRQISKPGWKWLLIASAMTATQVLLITGAIGFFHDATGVNVVYSTRGLWSIVLVCAIGGWIGNTERLMAGRAMVWRLSGALLISAAVALAVLAAKQAATPTTPTTPTTPAATAR